MNESTDLEAVVAAGNALASAIEAAGDNERYWPRDMRLDGTARQVEAALDGWYHATKQIENPAEERYVTKTGRVLTDTDIEALADEAERGYDVEHLKEKS